jgi:hypothetical protein
MAAPQFAVVQAKIEPIEPAHLEQALMAGAGMPKADASRASRRHRGFLLERASERQAADVASLLTQAGYAVRAIAAQQLVDLGRPTSINWLQIAPEHLGVPLHPQKLPIRVPWSAVFVVNAGHLSTLEQDVQEIESVSSRGMVHIETKRLERSERHPAVEIVGVSDRGQMFYARLIAPRLQGAKMPGVPLDRPRHEQFFAVLEPLVAHSSAALISPETRKMLVERHVDRTRSAGSVQHQLDERAFTDYSRWLLQLVMFREAERAQAASENY